jgi:hypothetical protein
MAPFWLLRVLALAALPGSFGVPGASVDLAVIDPAVTAVMQLDLPSGLLAQSEHIGRLRAKLKAGLPIKVVALGGSITFEFGGCFGDGCAVAMSSGKKGQAIGFGLDVVPSVPSGQRAAVNRFKQKGWLQMTMAQINATYPHARHALYNMGAGGVDPALYSSCIALWIPPDTDLVVADFAVNAAQPNQLVKALRLLREYPEPPAVLSVLFYNWCRGTTGSAAHPNRHDCSGFFERLRTRAEGVPLDLFRYDNVLKYADAVAAHGAGVLSLLHLLAQVVFRQSPGPPPLAMGDLTRDGLHPRPRSSLYPLAASRLLTHALLDSPAGLDAQTAALRRAALDHLLLNVSATPSHYPGAEPKKVRRLGARRPRVMTRGDRCFGWMPPLFPPATRAPNDTLSTLPPLPSSPDEANRFGSRAPNDTLSTLPPLASPAGSSRTLRSTACVATSQALPPSPRAARSSSTST